MGKYARVVISLRSACSADDREVDAVLESMLRDGHGIWLGWNDRDGEPASCDWDAHARASAQVAARILDIAEPTASIWVRDVPLLLFGRVLRRAGFGGQLGMFFDIPFPATEAASPWEAELIDGVLAFDRVGFQSRVSFEHFTAAARRSGAATTDGAIASRYRTTEIEVCTRASDVARRCLNGIDKHEIIARPVRRRRYDRRA